jgi:hypothetical protein
MISEASDIAFCETPSFLGALVGGGLVILAWLECYVWGRCVEKWNRDFSLEHSSSQLDG